MCLSEISFSSLDEMFSSANSLDFGMPAFSTWKFWLVETENSAIKLSKNLLYTKILVFENMETCQQWKILSKSFTERLLLRISLECQKYSIVIFEWISDPHPLSITFHKSHFKLFAGLVVSDSVRPVKFFFLNNLPTRLVRNFDIISCWAISQARVHADL